MRRVEVDRIELLTRDELAAHLKVTVWTIYSWLRKGLMPKPFTITPGSPHRWRAYEIEQWLDDLQRRPHKAKLRGALAKLARS